MTDKPSISDPKVSVAPVVSCGYAARAIRTAVLRNSERLGWATDDCGAFGTVIPAGAKVVIKPNLVLHANRGRGGLLELVTNAEIIIAVVEEALKADPSEVLIGDAPIQSCDLEALLASTGLTGWSAELEKTDKRFKGIADFRRTVSHLTNGVRVSERDRRPTEEYVLYNLATESLLEPISRVQNPFRVTCYDPRLLETTHSAGNHQYLIARQVIDADVVINLPKLKTHKKAGITNALKNLVGINGNKEYLPHHRLGGSGQGGDCYPGRDPIKGMLETVLDVQNAAESRTTEKAMSIVSNNLQRIMRLKGDEIGVEGSWSGNETVARMTLDLNRILLYGKSDGTLGSGVQRRVIHLCDGVVAGQGDGPLASEPLPLGILIASENAAAMDWIGAQFLGYDPTKIPLLDLAFTKFRWPIANFGPTEIILEDARAVSGFGEASSVKHPAGWRTAKVGGGE